jgi:hypothetical protein
MSPGQHEWEFCRWLTILIPTSGRLTLTVSEGGDHIIMSVSHCTPSYEEPAKKCKVHDSATKEIQSSKFCIPKFLLMKHTQPRKTFKDFSPFYIQQILHHISEPLANTSKLKVLLFSLVHVLI